MNRIPRSLLVLGAALAGAPHALAAPIHNTCVPGYSPPPFLSGPPTWNSSFGAGLTVEPSLEDPRWATSTALSFSASPTSDAASATAPMHVRAVYDPSGYLYVSFISDLSPSNTEIPRDLYVGFRLPANENDATTGSVPMASLMFQFHVGTLPVDPTASRRATPLVYCSKYNTALDGHCTQAGNSATSWWTVFKDNDTDDTTRTAQCGTGGPNGHVWSIWTAGGAAPIDWMSSGEASMWQFGDARAPDSTNADPDKRYLVSPLDAHRWAVQLRIKIDTAPAAGHTVKANGIPITSTYWFEATEHDSQGIFTSIAHWPRELTTAVCINPLATPQLIHQELGTFVSPAAGVPGCKNCSPDHYSSITMGSTGGATCDRGLAIDSAHIGTVNDPAITAYDNAPLTHLIKAYASATATDTTKATNVMVAQVVNNSSTDVTNVPLRVRFRAADWGTTWGVDAAWNDLPGQSPAGVPKTIMASKQAALTFNWQLTDDEVCGYGLGLRGASASCQACTCDGTVDNCASGEAGIKASTGSGKCYKKHASHQCMLAEVSAPNGGATFTQASAFNNWDFGENSKFEQVASIRVANLPQRDNETQVLLVLMPRNMPKQVSSQTGVTYVAEQLESAVHGAVAIDARDDVELDRRRTVLKRPPVELVKLRATRPELVDHLGDDHAVAVERARVALPDKEYARAGTLGDLYAKAHEVASHPVVRGEAMILNQTVVRTVGPETAAKIVPTLEIYPYFRPTERNATWQSMPGFSVFLSHDGGFTGFGDVQLSVPAPLRLKRLNANVYLLTVPRKKDDAERLKPVPLTVTSTVRDNKAPPIDRHPGKWPPRWWPPHGPHGPHDPDVDPHHGPHPVPLHPVHPDRN